MVKSPISLPAGFSIGVRIRRPVFGILLVIMRDRKASAPEPEKRYLAKLAISVTPTPLRVPMTSAFTCLKSLERRNDTMSFGSTPLGANHSGVSRPHESPITAPCAIIVS